MEPLIIFFGPIAAIFVSLKLLPIPRKSQKIAVALTGYMMIMCWPLLFLSLIALDSYSSAMAMVAESPKTISLQYPYQNEIEKAAKSANVDPFLVASIIATESDFDRTALGAAGEIGLGQIMPALASDCGLNDRELLIASKNAECSANYISFLIERYGELELAISAYNIGPVAVDECLCVPGNHEYVNKVLTTFSNFQERYVPNLEWQLLSPHHTLFENGWHCPGGLCGYDFISPCDTLLSSPIEGEVTYNGIDGWQNTVLRIE